MAVPVDEILPRAGLTSQAALQEVSIDFRKCHDLTPLTAANAPNPGVVLANSDLPQRYAIEFQPERIADICQTYGLRFPGVID